MGRSILAVLLGTLAAGVSVALIEGITSTVNGRPASVMPSDPASMQAYMRQIPASALVFVLLAWTVGSFVGGWVSASLAPRAPLTHAITFGLVFIAIALVNLMSFPHPLWFWVAGLGVVLPAAEIGACIARARPARGSSLAGTMNP
jgi:hypothetical protein